MESVRKMRSAHEKKRENAAAKDPVTGEELGLGDFDKSLAEIRANPAEQELFLNRFIYQEDPDVAKDIVEKLATNALLSDKEDLFLEKCRKEFNLRRLECTRAQELLTEEAMQSIARMDKNVGTIVGKIGVEEAIDLMKGQLLDLSVSDDKGFKKMIKGLQGVRDVGLSESGKTIDAKVEQALKNAKMDEKTYWNITEAGMSMATKDKMEEEIKKNFEWYQTALNWVSFFGYSHYKSRALYGTFQEQQKLMDDSDVHYKSIGKVLSGTINADARLRIQKFVTEGGKIEEKRLEKINTLAEYKTASKELEDMTALKARYKTFRDETVTNARTKLGNPAWNPSLVEEDRIKDTFAKMEKVDHNTKYRARGLFGALLSLLFKSEADIKAAL